MIPRPASDEPAAIPPSLIASAAQKVYFLHPGYDGDFTATTFLTLACLDDGGVCFDTALVACGVIACNQWSGFLSTDKDGRSRVDRPADGILRDHPCYYFHLPASSDSSLPYPIVTRFSDWSFPHRNLPALWARLQLQTNANMPPVAVGQRAGSCVASNYSNGVDAAHCVPSNEREWWELNAMDFYASSSALVFSTTPQDSPANLIPLRADFHRIFDARLLCFAPKTVEGPDATAQAQTRLLIHVFVPSPDGQIAGLWHNRALHALPLGLSKECLFARFAYTILSPSIFCSTFLSAATVARHLCVLDPVTQTHELKMESPEDCRKILRAARSRTPRKRSAPSTGNGDDVGSAGGYFNGDEKALYRPYGPMLDFGPGPVETTDSDGEWERRGRKRIRT